MPPPAPKTQMSAGTGHRLKLKRRQALEHDGVVIEAGRAKSISVADGVATLRLDSGGKERTVRPNILVVNVDTFAITASGTKM